MPSPKGGADERILRLFEGLLEEAGVAAAEVVVNVLKNKVRGIREAEEAQTPVPVKKKKKPGPKPGSKKQQQQEAAAPEQKQA